MHVPALPVAVLRCDAQEYFMLDMLGAFGCSFGHHSTSSLQRAPSKVLNASHREPEWIGTAWVMTFIHCYLSEVILLVCVVILCTGMCTAVKPERI